MRDRKTAIDKEEALNNKRFVEFLDHDTSAEIFDASNQRQLEEMYRKFQLKEKGAIVLKDALVKALNWETDGRAKLTQGDIPEIEKFFSDLVMTRPDEAEKIIKAAEEMVSLPAKVDALEQGLAKDYPLVKGGRQNLKKAKQASLPKRLTGFGRLWGSPSARQPFALLKEDFGKMTLGGARRQIDKIDNADTLRLSIKDRFNELRTQIFENVDELKEVRDLIKKRLDEKQAELIVSKDSLASYDEEAQNLERQAESGDFFDDEGGTADEKQERMYELIEGKLKLNFEEIFKRELSGTPLNSLRADIRKLTDKERLGAARGREVKQFIKESLEEFLNSPLGKALPKNRQSLILALTQEL